MKKTLTVNLNSIVFNIDDDAYEVLSKYLSDIASHFSSDEEKDEIMADIEARIAELFGERLQRNKEVISMNDVREIIAILGNPNQFSSDESEKINHETADNAFKSNEKKKRQRRFYRDPENAVLGGVCGGLAAYFNTDVTIVRIVLVALTIFSSVILFGAGGFLIPAYFLAWVIVPKAVTASQRLEMRGEDATVENIKAEFENVKNYVESEQFKSNAKSVGNRLGEVFGWVFKVFFIALGAILAFPLAITLLVLLFVLFVLLIVAIFVPTAVFSELVPASFFGWSMLLSFENSIMLIVSLLLIIGCPVFLLIRALTRRKSNQKPKSRTAVWIAIVLWFAGIFMFAGTAVISADGWRNWENNRVSWNWNSNDWSIQPRTLNSENFITEIRNVADFKHIDISGYFEIKIENSPNQQLVLNASKDFISNVTTEVRGETLFVSYPKRLGLLKNPVRISLSSDDLEKITARKGVNIKNTSTFKSENFHLILQSGSNADLDVEIENEFNIRLSAGSIVKLRGESETLTLHASSGSIIDAENLKAKHVNINISSGSSAQVYASKSLNVNASSGASIICSGNPENVRKNTSSGASVRMR